MQRHRPERARARLVLLVLLAAALLAGIVHIRSSDRVLSAHYNVQTTAGRQTYLRALGWEIAPESERLQSTIVPETFDALMEQYNDLQLSQGFDLHPWAGKTATVVTYRVTNASADVPTEITLWISGAVVIAGDVHETAMDGEMRSIIRSNAEQQKLPSRRVRQFLVMRLKKAH